MNLIDAIDVHSGTELSVSWSFAPSLPVAWRWRPCGPVQCSVGVGSAEGGGGAALLRAVHSLGRPRVWSLPMWVARLMLARFLAMCVARLTLARASSFALCFNLPFGRKKTKVVVNRIGDATFILFIRLASRATVREDTERVMEWLVIATKTRSHSLLALARVAVCATRCLTNFRCLETRCLTNFRCGSRFFADCAAPRFPTCIPRVGIDSGRCTLLQVVALALRDSPLLLWPL